MFLNETFQKYYKLSFEVHALLVKNGVANAGHFFPQLYNEYDFNGRLLKKADEGKLASIVHASNACCGLSEVSLAQNCSGVVEWLPDKVQKEFVETGLLGKDKQARNDTWARCQVAWIVGQLYKEQDGYRNPGLLFYCGTADYVHPKILKEFGWVKLADFVNPTHNHHMVEMLACHTKSTSEYMQQSGRAAAWEGALATKAA